MRAAFSVRSKPTLRTLWAPLALIFIASLAWALTTPLAGSPDEPAHIIKAAGAANGQFLPDGADEVGRGYFEIPASLSDARAWEDCFAHNSTAEASCQVIDGNAEGTAKVATTASQYNPLYYVVVGWPSLLTTNPHGIVYAMRILTGLVSALFAALAFHFLAQMMSFQRASLVAAAVITPMVLFLSGSVNPNAWEITGSLAMLAALLSLGHRRETGPVWPALATIAIAGAVVANMRGVSPLWVAVIGGIGLLAIAGPALSGLIRRPLAWVAIAVVAVGMLLSVAWSMLAGAFALNGDFSNKEWTIGQVLDSMIRRTVFEGGYVGLFGWTDSGAPLIAIVIIGGLGIAALVTVLALGRGWPLIASILMMGAWLLLPALVQLNYVRTAGMIWQARYTLVLYTAAIVIAAVASSARIPRIELPNPIRAIWVLGGVVTAAHVYTFMVTQLRYARGSDSTIWMLFKDPLWSPPGGAPLWLAVTALACLGFTALVAADSRRTRRTFVEDAYPTPL